MLLLVCGKQRILLYTRKELIKGYYVAIQNKYVPDGTVYGMALYVMVNVKDMLNLRYRILFIAYSARIFSSI